MAKIGDTVRFLNSTGGGRIVRIEGNIAHVEDSDGFEIPALLKECVVVMEATAAPKSSASKTSAPKTSVPASYTSSYPSKETPAPAAKAAEPELPKIETAGGDKLNVVMAFEASDLKSLSASDFDAVLVNDSNYYLNFSFATRADDDDKWTLRRAGVVEPNIVLTLCTLEPKQLNAIDRALLQFVAYKDDKQFEAKEPVSVEKKVDNTKFFKLHCFKPNPYFDTSVIAFDIVKDDRPAKEIVIDPQQLQKAIREKNESEHAPRKISKPTANRKNDIIEVDLHINELLDSTKGMSRAEMLNHQIDEFRKVMDANLRNHGQKIVFIHGKGEGVLRQALLKELTHRYKGHDVSDASFREYGFGATQVVIK